MNYKIVVAVILIVIIIICIILSALYFIGVLPGVNPIELISKIPAIPKIPEFPKIEFPSINPGNLDISSIAKSPMVMSIASSFGVSQTQLSQYTPQIESAIHSGIIPSLPSNINLPVINTTPAATGVPSGLAIPTVIPSVTGVTSPISSLPVAVPMVSTPLSNTNLSM